MCRNIRTLFNFDPPATDDEIQAAALQFVRKVSGATKPSKVNEAVFQEAIDAVTEATRTLLRALVTKSPAKSRDEEREKAKKRWQKRAQRIAAEST